MSIPPSPISALPSLSNFYVMFLNESVLDKECEAKETFLQLPKEVLSQQNLPRCLLGKQQSGARVVHQVSRMH